MTRPQKRFRHITENRETDFERQRSDTRCKFRVANLRDSNWVLQDITFGEITIGIGRREFLWEIKCIRRLQRNNTFVTLHYILQRINSEMSLRSLTNNTGGFH
jgi:hypothetical protein